MTKPAYFSKGFAFFVISVIFLWGVCAWILLSIHSSSAKCSENYRTDATIIVNGHKLATQIASSLQKQEQGLSGRSCLGADQAMLFIFDKPGNYPFWMKDMNFNVDIVWASADKQAVDVQSGVSPKTYPKSFVNQQPAKYVLELQSGRANALGLQTGTKLKF